ncbi:hypothetical protein [Salinarimonas sp.]|uniref:hypothetical protein n=1 Tax=Salinarimonas sp. TaxID=2766526 RepID=UPI0032D94E01
MLNLRLTDFFVIDRRFATASEVKRIVADKDGAAGGALEAMLFFATDKQQSWFVANSRRLFLVIDKKDEEAPRVRWSVPLEAGRSMEVGSKSLATGTIAIAGKRPRFFTTKLFADEPLQRRLRNMLDRAAAQGAHAA